MLSRFLRDRRGNIAPMMAMLAVPLIGSAGVAIDYTQASATRTSFQTALDATALAMSKTAATQNAADLQASASAYFNALFSSPTARDVVVNATYTGTAGSKLALNATATLKTNVLGILGYGDIPIAAAATSTWGETRLRVALVLDNTGSMSSAGKMTALKTASQNLLTQLKNAALLPEDVYVSVVPFSKDVNVGADKYDRNWINWSLWEAVNGTCSNSSYKSKSSCESRGKVWTPAAHDTWNGCVTDRDQNYDTTNDPPVAGGTLYPAEQYSSCPAALMELSNDWTSLSARIDAMQPAGNTNQAIGLQMGWQTLTASPFTVPEFDSNYQYNQVIILLTDGMNTENRWYTSQSSIDKRQQKTCDNIKAAGITLYTVQVNTGNDPTSTMLQNCASNSSKYFLLKSGDQIISTFNQIGTALSELRLSQ
ncbi:TadE/TadG family type IV pilus assembly protein [Undibacter mobilis]|nr:TadE/TadG family type IV pilus assembly protein [Undibacter mobilis]